MPLYSNTKVTMELRDVLASRDENGKPFNLWDFDYPSYYKGEDKTNFEQLVIDHYLFHQIGVETIQRFKHNFKTRIREIMPYYIQMYKSVEIMEAIEDPFGNVDIVETFEQTSSDTTSGTTSHSENGTSSSSDNTSRTENGTSSGSGSSSQTENGTSSSSGTTSQTENGTSTSSEKASKTDDKTASENSTHKFSNTPQGSITNLDNYLTEAAIDNKSQTENITSEGTVTTSSESDNTSSGSSETESETSATRTGESTSESASNFTASGSNTSESENTLTSSGTTASENNGTVKHTLTRKGNQGVNTYAHDMIEYRQSFINVDMQVIGALRDLFLLVY